MSWIRTALRTLIRTEPCRSLSGGRGTILAQNLNGCGIREIHLTKHFFFFDRGTPIFSMLCNYDPSQCHPQESIINSISEASKTGGRKWQAPNVIIGGQVTGSYEDEWLELDRAVNTYPMVRGFVSIGTGGDDFIRSMIVAVESVIQQPIPKGHIRHKVSSKGKYVSVHIGPIQVVSSQQVQAVYNAMRRDNRMKFFL